MKNKIVCIFLLLSAICEATDLKPWFGKEYEAEIRATLLYQNYNSVSAPHQHGFKQNANDAFLTLSAAYPFMKYCGEFEATAANTHYQNCRWDNFRFTGRYQWLDEKNGYDDFSSVVGFTIIQPFSRALHDISSFHHGHIECEFTLSAGKEYGYSDCNDFRYRWWNVLGVGVADVGLPWIREYFAFEYNYEDVHQFRGFVDTLWGTGTRNLREFCFSGYGHIAHKSIDVGFRYTYDFDCWGTLSIQYARRVYASNFPENANLAFIEYYLPFGTQFSCSY